MNNKYPDIKSMCWHVWGNKPLPTQDEWDIAVSKYIATLKEGDWTDYPSGLEFVMATYSKECWIGFFS